MDKPVVALRLQFIKKRRAELEQESGLAGIMDVDAAAALVAEN